MREQKGCSYCGVEFVKHPKESGKQWAARRFCSRRCSARWRTEQRPPNRASGACAGCQTYGPFHGDGLCRRCWDKRRYREQRERILALNRAWREANRDYWRQPHIVDRVRRWHARHPDRVREITRAALRRRRARLNGAPVGDPALTDAYALILRCDPCSYCGAPGEHLDHIVAVSRGGGHVWDNLTSACTHCNVSKYSASLLEFLLYRQRPQTGQGDAPACS
jgi:5-methylcytosine-specific restriction endonuclease McrA